MTLYKGDNTTAFGNQLMTVELENNTEHTVSKVQIRIGNIIKTIENPDFPIEIDLDEEQTKLLTYSNEIYMVAYDEDGKKLTCERDGVTRINTKEAVIK